LVYVVEPAVEVVIEPGDSPVRIVEKAAAVRPRRAQLEWQRLEVLAFTHYGMNTFTNREGDRPGITADVCTSRDRHGPSCCPLR
jgi:hypothetical protein